MVMNHKRGQFLDKLSDH